MDPYVYKSYTVRTSYVVSTPVTKMDYSHITFLAYLFSTIFPTSTSIPRISTMAPTELKISKTNPIFPKKYYPTTTSQWIRPQWYNEHDYWRNIVSKELAFHEKSTITRNRISTTKSPTTKSPIEFADLFAGQFLPPRCCSKKTLTTASVSMLVFDESTEINLFLKNDDFSVAQICILIVLCLILVLLVGFSVRIILRARIKRKINIRSKEACEMSSFSTRMRKHVRDSVHDFDVTTDLLECTRIERDKFEDVSLKSKTGLANENFGTKFTTTVDIHPSINV
jgi:hypothetical protein